MENTEETFRVTPETFKIFLTSLEIPGMLGQDNGNIWYTEFIKQNTINSDLYYDVNSHSSDTLYNITMYFLDRNLLWRKSSFNSSHWEKQIDYIHHHPRPQYLLSILKSLSREFTPDETFIPINI